MLRWTLAMVWTMLVLFLMLSPGDSTQVNGPSQSAGGSEVTDALGHVVLFAILTGCWLWATFPTYQAGSVSIAIVALGVLLELTQHFVPERGISLLDLSANATGVVLTALFWARYRSHDT